VPSGVLKIFALYSLILFPVGGERAATVRQKRAGKLCTLCDRPFPEPHTPGERLCLKCAEARPPTRRVYMHFMHGKDWYCQFLEADLKTSLPRKVRFQDKDQLIAFARRGGCDRNLVVQQPFEHDLSIGRGGIWLELTEAQYRRLK
jgi:hypothetical protein